MPHTPAPWTLGEENVGSGFNIYAGHLRVAHTSIQARVIKPEQRPLLEEEAKANAQLIVDAVNEFEALRRNYEHTVEDRRKVYLEFAAAQSQRDRLDLALREIAGKNNLEGVSDDEAYSALANALYECEMIARAALSVTSDPPIRSTPQDGSGPAVNPVALGLSNSSRRADTPAMASDELGGGQ